MSVGTENFDTLILINTKSFTKKFIRLNVKGTP